MRAIAEREDEAGEQKADVAILEDRIEKLDSLSTEYSWVLEGVRQDEERDEKVALKNIL